MHVRAAGILLLPLFLMSTPGGASADLAKCEAKLLKASSKLGINVSKSLQKCTAGARKAIAKNGAVDAKAADGCEKNLAKIFNIGGDAGKGMINKTLKSFDKLFSAGKEVCTSEDLAALGLLESGVNAPGVAAQDFLASWLVMREAQLAITEVTSGAADLQNLLTAMIDITDCASGLERPNLCTFAANENPDCITQTCNMNSSSRLFLKDNSLPASLQDHPVTIQVCRAPSTLVDLPIDFGDSYRALSLGMATRIGPTTLTGTNGTVCIDQMRAIGWCDCNGAGVAFEPTTCRDHVANDNAGTCSVSAGFCLTDDDCPDRDDVCSAGGTDDCGADLAGATLESDCVRGGTPAGDCQAGTGKCIDRRTVGACHSGTYRGAPALSYGGASGAGDCMLEQTMMFRVLPPAVCVNGSGDALGACTTTCDGGPCAADVTCSGLGGSNCVDSKGADGAACTRDDRILPGEPTRVAFSTGFASSSLKDRTAVQGTCSGASVNAGMNCLTDQDCNGGVCSGEVLLPGPAAATDTGSPLTCAAMDGGDLSGLRLVGGFAWLDGSGAGDQSAMITLECD